MTVIPPGATLGILGGGQLGRMTALAAAAMGYRCHIFCQDEDAPAAQVSAAATVAPFDDPAALDEFAAAVSVVTAEFENVPAAALARISRLKPVRPGLRAQEIAQDRLLEKDFVGAQGIETVAYHAVDSVEDFAAATELVRFPAILKTRRDGYDGKGQIALADAAGAPAAWQALGGVPAILETRIDFDFELSVIVARSADGEMAAYDPARNSHGDGILLDSTVPAGISGDMARRAIAIAESLAGALDLVGLLAVEIFATKDGGLLVNEFAPRPHNSGHWTIDACQVSQFQQLVRAICGLPLGDPARQCDAVMRNLIGGDVERWPAEIADPRACLHIYGKDEARPGRKMGHVTVLKPRQSSR